MHRPVVAAGAAAAPAANASPRRAVDVAVLGNSLQAYAMAYLLAKRGKRTVVIEHAAPQLVAAGSAGRRPDVVLHLPATTPHLVNEATEAMALWRGIEAASGARSLLQLCGSIDMAPTRGSSAASEALGMMQDASKAAGLPFGMLSPEEVTASFPRLRPPNGSAGLYTNIGGVVHGSTAAAVLLAMAQRAGADVAAPPGRCLLGWRDVDGSHFVLRTTGADAAAASVGQHIPAASRGGAAVAAGNEVIFECEQLVLLPDAAVLRQSLALFGLGVPGAQLWQVPAGRWKAQEECAALPLWQLLGTGSTRLVDDPSAIDSCWGLPVLDWAPSTVWVSQSLADGQPIEQQQGRQAAVAPGGSSSGGNGSIEAGQAAAAAQQAAAAAAEAAEAADERPGSIEAEDAERQRQAEQQRRLELAQRRLATAGGLTGRLIQGIGGRIAGSDSLQQCLVTPDGESAAGSHPGHEERRIVAAFPAAGSPGSLPASQLALLVAKLALSQLLGQPPEAVSAAVVALDREILQAEAVGVEHDSWREMSRNLIH